jgi:hypothetical protein
MTTYSGTFSGIEGGGDIGQTAVWSGTLTVDTVANTATITIKYTDTSPLPVNPNFSGSDTENLAANVIFFVFPQSPGWRADFTGFGNLFGGQSTITGNVDLTYFPTSTQDETSVTLTSGAAPPPPSDTTPPVLVHDKMLTAVSGITVFVPGITSNLLAFSDPDNSDAQLTYTVVSAPRFGVLRKNGSATNSFTQVDIDNGLISYQVTTGALTGIALDTFMFTVSDPAGNTSSTTAFHQ